MYASENHADQWVSNKDLIVCEGNIINLLLVEQLLDKLVEDYDVKVVAFDRHQGLQMMNIMSERGVPVASVSFGKQLSETSKDLRSKIYSEGIGQSGNKVARWCFESAQVKTFYDETIVVKRVDRDKEKKRVDAVHSAILALDRYIFQVEEHGPVFGVFSSKDFD